MGRVRVFSALSNLDPKEFVRFCSAWVVELTSQINGNLQFGLNIKASGPTVLVFPSASVMSIDHSLGVIPSGWLTVSTNSNTTLFKPSGAQYEWTDSKIYLSAAVACTVKIYII